MTAEIIRCGVFDMQVCVPSDWTDEQVKQFVDKINPSGTPKGWTIRRQGNEALHGADERVPCHTRANHIHIVVEA